MRCKRIIKILPILAALVTAATGQTKLQTPPPAPHEYFFYQLALLRRPADAPQLTPEAGQKLQDAHLANIHKLYKEGKLVMAGPFLDDTPLRGIFVFQAKSELEAQKWANSDPAVQAHRLEPELHMWIQPTSTFRKPPESNPMENYAAVLYFKSDKFQWPSGSDPTWQRHMDFVKSQPVTDKLAAGAPFKDGMGDGIALLIFATTPEEASQIVARDPLILAGEAKTEVHPWMTQKGVLPK